MKTWIIIATACFASLAVGAGLGAVAASSDPKDSEEYRHQQSLVKQKNEALNDAADALEQSLVDLEAIEGDLPAREKAVMDAQAQADADAATVEKARKDTLKLLNQVEKRERAVGIVEADVARNTIAGDGTYRVGKDMKGGTYRSTDNGAGCYYSISSDPNGQDIIDNGFTEGPSLASVSEGQFFETSNCGDWVLQR
jgi:hypothetical protein